MSCLFLFSRPFLRHSPDCPALTLNFRVPPLLAPSPIYVILVPCSSQTLFTNAIALQFLIAKQNSGKSLFEQARAKSSEHNKDSTNGEEVQKELQEAATSGCRRALAIQ